MGFWMLNEALCSLTVEKDWVLVLFAIQYELERKIFIFSATTLATRIIKNKYPVSHGRRR